MIRPNAICTIFPGLGHMKVNVYFDSLDGDTLPILAKIREWRSRNIKVWLSRETHDAPESRQYVLHARDGFDVVDNIAVDRSVCFFEWDVVSQCVRQVFNHGTFALLSRPWTDLVIVGKGEKVKNRLIAFSDSSKREDLPSTFIKIPWMNTADQLQEYCQGCGVFAFSLKDERYFAPTNKFCKGARVYREKSTGCYYYFDTLHCSHYELFDGDGRHLAEVDLDGNVDKSKADSRKRLDLG